MYSTNKGANSFADAADKDSVKIRTYEPTSKCKSNDEEQKVKQTFLRRLCLEAQK